MLCLITLTQISVEIPNFQQVPQNKIQGLSFSVQETALCS